jgi:translocator protein
MPRLDRFVDPVHKGIDKMKHLMEDGYDSVMPQQTSQSWIASWFSRPSSHHPIASRFGAKIGEKVADTFSGGQHYGRHEPGVFQKMMGYEEEGLLQRFLYNVEEILYNSGQGVFMFVAYPLFMALFVSSWAHRQVRNNRAYFDRLTLPSTIPPDWLYDPMWITVLSLMGYASWLVFLEGGFGNWFALGCYNLAVTSLCSWPILFFNLTDTVVPPIVASLLSLLSLTTCALFFSHSTLAGLYLIPATLWFTYMTTVNWQLYFANRGVTRPTGPKEKGRTSIDINDVGTAAILSQPYEAKKVR